ncbi:hypothetical protein [Actinomyces faecalis]|uniref:hypothetical protein n=1 Tax=Actinomyces faecalis TaxID=2722820 RepID=UPI0015538AD5|nr:hypothetical protein [Actinomyces faecalis]
MSPDSPDLPPLDDVADLGSWSRFQPSLATFLDRCRGQGEYLTLLLTTPSPVATSDSLSQPRGLRALLRRRPAPVASHEVPGVVLTVRTDGVEVALPVLDAVGAVLLPPQAVEDLEALGWRRHTDLLVRLLPDGASAADAVARVLIEVLDVAHPADLDHLLTRLG